MKVSGNVNKKLNQSIKNKEISTRNNFCTFVFEAFQIKWAGKQKSRVHLKMRGGNL